MEGWPLLGSLWPIVHKNVDGIFDVANNMGDDTVNRYWTNHIHYNI